ncbi:DUF397 domain-containing protein [Streptomyces sp. ID05-47C]|uniref:DUF397 domain-containing protein n=1 Tax=Streptomyces sp. ID05-47C TaxID=3028665 RepID=UPI0039F4FB82
MNPAGSSVGSHGRKPGSVVAQSGGASAVRDSKNKRGGELRLTEDRTRAFLTSVKADAFNM